ncbi:MAG: response regulator transcription factor [Chloroflexi bacterium]|nr:response regulator transcription factor [Chloroflexota bacterium]
MQARQLVTMRRSEGRLLERVIVGVAAAIDRDLTYSLLETELAVKSVTDPDLLSAMVAEFAPDAVLVGTAFLRTHEARALAALSELRVTHQAPVFAVLGEDDLDSSELLTAVDDFVLRPVRISELEARLRQSRSRRAGSDTQSLLRSGELLLDAARYRVQYGGREVFLTFTEFRLLKLLMQHQGKVITRDVIMRQIWNTDYYAGMRTVDVVVRRLRSKMEMGDTRPVIRTVRNVGYMLAEMPARSRTGHSAI